MPVIFDAQRSVQRRVAALILPLALVWPALGLSADRRFRFDLPTDRVFEFSIPFEVDQLGRIDAAVDWDGSRPLVLRLEGPDGTVSRRAGPSPQSLRAEIAFASGLGTWTLTLRGLPARERATGSVVLSLPPPPTPVGDPPASSGSTPPTIEPWALPITSRSADPPPLRALIDAVEALRRNVVLADGTRLGDPCGWQAELLVYLRTAIIADPTLAPPLTEASRRYLRRTADAIEAIEALNNSTDPLLVSAPTEDSPTRRAWESLMRARLQPLETELDELERLLREGHVPEFETQPWVPRLLACATTCERYWSEALRIGPELAPHRDVASKAWPAIRLAGDALRRLADLPLI